jgi:hypothetical protein
VMFLHYVQHIVDIPEKRVAKFKVPVHQDGVRVWLEGVRHVRSGRPRELAGPLLLADRWHVLETHGQRWRACPRRPSISSELSGLVRVRAGGDARCRC